MSEWLRGLTVRSHTLQGKPWNLVFHTYSLLPGREAVWGLGKGPHHLSAQPASRRCCQSLNSGRGGGSTGAQGLTWDHVALDFVSDRRLKSWQAWPSGWVPSSIKIKGSDVCEAWKKKKKKGCTPGPQSLTQDPWGSRVTEFRIFQIFRKIMRYTCIYFITPLTEDTEHCPICKC